MIRLHKEHGVNPRLTFCPRCHGEANELMLLGTSDKKYQCQTCNLIHYGHPRLGRCQSSKCKSHDIKFIGVIEEHERLPASQPCDTCQKELSLHASVVAKGGVYWKCTKCGNSGVIKHTSPFSTMVRKAHGLNTPDSAGVFKPCGIDFEGKEQCPICHP